MNQKKSVSFATILLLGLIVSTVIVFAVLLFLSYESILNSTFEQQQLIVDNSGIAFAQNAEIVIDGDESFVLAKDDYKSKVIIGIANNLAKNNGGATYIVDSSFTKLYSKNPIKGFDLNPSSITLQKHLCEKLQRDERTSIIYSVQQIGSTDMYVIYAEINDSSEAIEQFNSVVLFPAIIAVVVAVVLFVLATQLTLTPIREMTRVFGKLSEGDYSARVDEKFTKASNQHFTTASGDIVVMASVVNDMITKLENQENDRQIFISSVAHDIRTPLTSINGFVTAIMDGTIPPENQEHYLGLIKKELNRIKTLVVTMTEASSLSHVDPSVMEKFDVTDVINDIVGNLEPQFQEKSITAEVRLDNSANAKMCYGEAQQLCRVIVNIISNAIKFTPNSGKIIVSTKADNDNKKVFISVEDSGIGIPEEKRSRVFESFYKVDTSRTHEGFGLGLYICKQILAGHGQTIYLEEGKELGGAKFVFSFPMPPEGK